MTVAAGPDTRTRLLDCRAIMTELGVKRATAEALMRELPKVRIGRKVFVYRQDMDRYLRERTITDPKARP